MVAKAHECRDRGSHAFRPEAREGLREASGFEPASASIYAATTLPCPPRPSMRISVISVMVEVPAAMHDPFMKRLKLQLGVILTASTKAFAPSKRLARASA